MYGVCSTVEQAYMYWGKQLEYVATILDSVTCSAVIMFVSLSSVHDKVQSMSGMSYKVPVDRNCDSLQYVGYSFHLDSLQAAWQRSLWKLQVTLHVLLSVLVWPVQDSNGKHRSAGFFVVTFWLVVCDAGFGWWRTRSHHFRSCCADA